MKEVDFESQVSSEDEGLNSDKLVPVSEAIRYRKRAQSAEKQVSVLEHELDESRSKNGQLAGQLNDFKLDHKLVAELTTAGAVDLEAAVLIAKARMAAEEVDVDSVVEQLKKEKGYLFAGQETGVVALRTAGAKEKTGGIQRTLERTAKKAATSGSRADMQEYLTVRRQYV